MRDEILRLPDFLRHYRGLGLEKFIVIDNGSTDGTVECLLDQPDVDLFSCAGPFQASRFGTYWCTGLLRSMGTSGWVLQADVDEHLVYDGCERHGLDSLVTQLEMAGRRSLPAMMLDMYPPGPIDGASPAPGQRMIDVCPLFDGEGYRVTGDAARWEVPRNPRYLGGPRERLFSTGSDRFYCELAKTPLVRWDADVIYMSNHTVYPYELNFGGPAGCLLHFKLLGDLRDRARDAVARGNHYAGSIEYRRYLSRLDEDPGVSAVFEGSRGYRDSASLVEAGMMTPIDWR